MKTTKKQLRIYTNALIKAVCESKLNAKVDFTKNWVSLWVFGEGKVEFNLDIYVNGDTRKENHAKFKEMMKYLKGGINGK